MPAMCERDGVPSSGEPEDSSVDLTTYFPKDENDFIILDIPVPERDFQDRLVFTCTVIFTVRGVIAMNIVHRDYPRDLLHAQAVPGVLSNNGPVFNVFCASSAEEENEQIPPDVARRIVTEDILPSIASDSQTESLFNLITSGRN